MWLPCYATATVEILIVLVLLVSEEETRVDRVIKTRRIGQIDLNTTTVKRYLNAFSLNLIFVQFSLVNAA